MKKNAVQKIARLLSVGLLLMLALSVIPAVQAQNIPLNLNALLHDSRNDLYRTPVGAVPAGTTVTLRLRTAAGELDAAAVRLFSSAAQTLSSLPMTRVTTTPDGFDLWEAQLAAGEGLTVYYYRFSLVKDGEIYLYEDDYATPEGEAFEARRGGAGIARSSTTNADYQIAVYDPDFYTPEWMRNAVIYQIFPDRFRNGDSSNDPADESDTFYGDVPLYFHETWNEPPVNGRETLLPNGAGWWNADFYGGDLAGITEKLDYLQSLGVTALYLNPIFEARSNHRYDTADYMTIDRRLGTLEDFQGLVSEAEARGMRIILDGVFNHLSSDSLFFDRYNRYETDGACESVESEYRNWFIFAPAEGTQPSPCMGDDGNVYYVSWAGFDSIPQVDNTIFATRAYFVRGQESVARYWGGQGIGGWRLDAAEQIDDGRDPDNNYWESLRSVARVVDPESVIVGEFWGDASEWLLGDEWDSVTNYRFRRGLIGFLRGEDYPDADGLILGLTPTDFEATLRGIEEDYPPMAYHALMNVVDSHDTSRILFALDNDVDALELAALAQFTLPGAPTIYYGDEIALDAPSVLYGQRFEDDPFNRAPYPWPDEEGDHYPAPNEDVLAYYQALGQARQDHPALSEGELITLSTSDEQGVFAYARVNAAANDAAIVVLNTSDAEQTIELFFETILPNTVMFEPLFNQGDFTSGFATSQGRANITVAPNSGNVWLVSDAPAQAFETLPVPETVNAAAETGSVTLSWDAVDGAVGYQVYRSPVAVGGFLPIMRLTGETTFADSNVSNGFPYYYA
ncbi:MAG: glycoside hydrolase family 13 protein, partial [bacterium]|nr:glycoside hydrolase family 13 protein [bacterium]